MVPAGLQTDLVKFLIFFVDLFLTTMCAASFAFVVGASVNSYGTGQVVLVMVFVLMMVRLICSVLISQLKIGLTHTFYSKS